MSQLTYVKKTLSYTSLNLKYAEQVALELKLEGLPYKEISSFLNEIGLKIKGKRITETTIKNWFRKTSKLSQLYLEIQQDLLQSSLNKSRKKMTFLVEKAVNQLQEMIHDDNKNLRFKAIKLILSNSSLNSWQNDIYKNNNDDQSKLDNRNISKIITDKERQLKDDQESLSRYRTIGNALKRIEEAKSISKNT